MTTVATVEEVLNLALDRVGYPRSISNINAGTKEARIGLRIYSQTRDDLLRVGEWGFAQREVALNLLKTAPVGGYGLTPWTPASPQLPWIYEYQYPGDCIKVRAIRPTPIFIPDFAPRAHVFNIANDYALDQKIILTNVPNAICVYTGQVVDVTVWEPAFVEALVSALAVKFAEALTGSPEMAKEKEAVAARDEMVADRTQG
jgi:hypothetical protein